MTRQKKLLADAEARVIAATKAEYHAHEKMDRSPADSDEYEENFAAWGECVTATREAVRALLRIEGWVW